MKKLVIFISFLIALSASAQVNINKSFDRRNIGLAKELVGEVNVLAIFIDDKDGLSQKDKEAYIKCLEEAERWLVKEGKTYGKKVSFNNYYLGRDKTIRFIPKRMWQDEMPMDIISAAFGYNSQAAYNWFFSHPNCAVIMFTNSKEWCSARAAFALNSDSPKRPQMEIARIHNYEMKEKSLEIAHEILHLFGAWDLYNTNMFKGDWRNHISTLTVDCNSIMNDVWGTINDHHVDELNAYLIGWSKTWKEWYINFQN